MILAYCKETHRECSPATRVAEAAPAAPGAAQAASAPPKPAPAVRWGIRRGGGGGVAEPERALVEDPNDELCRICWQGVRHFGVEAHYDTHEPARAPIAWQHARPTAL